MNTFTHVEPTDTITIEAIIHDIIDAQIAGDEDEIQALIQVLLEKLDTLYSDTERETRGLYPRHQETHRRKLKHSEHVQAH